MLYVNVEEKKQLTIIRFGNEPDNYYEYFSLRIPGHNNKTTEFIGTK